jgi:hypothetical protein
LTNAIYGYIDMTHGQILKHRTSHADQCSRFTNQKSQHRCQCRCRDGRSIQYFQTPSVPLYPRSPKGWNQRSGSRTQDCIYRQVITESDPSVKRPCKNIRDQSKRNRNPGLRKISKQRPEAWIKSIRNKSSLNFVLIDYLPKNLHWHTSF